MQGPQWAHTTSCWKPTSVCALQKYRLYLKRMSGLHLGANGRKGGGKGGSLPHDANFQVSVVAFLQFTVDLRELARAARLPAGEPEAQTAACVLALLPGITMPGMLQAHMLSAEGTQGRSVSNNILGVAKAVCCHCR